MPCDHLLQWIYKAKKYESWVSLRSQNSYNSGIWTDYLISSAENQKVFWTEYNDKTKTIFYDQRIIISTDRPIPVVWKVTKVEDMNVRGIARYTCAQDRFNEHTDYVERNEEGEVLGMWAGYFTDNVPIQEPDEDDIPTTNIRSSISYSGTKPEMKIGGNYKTFTVTFFDDDGEVEFVPGIWNFEIDNNDATDLLDIQETQNENQIKLKFHKGLDVYIGKDFVVSYKTESGIKSSVVMNITGL